MELKAGMRLRSSACSSEVIVVRAPTEEVDLRCGGVPMTALTEPAVAALDPGFSDGTKLGKRYSDPTSGLEVLCTKAGEGSLSLGADPLPVKEAKPLPSSD